MSTPVNSQIIYVNSRNKTGGTHSDFTIQIPTLQTHTDFDSVTVLQADIPKSYYLVQASNQTFTLTENGASTPVVLPIGNYNRTSLKVTLVALLTAASTTLGNNYTYSIIIPNTQTAPDTGKFTFQSTAPTTAAISFTFGNSSPYEFMGFDPGSTNAFASVSGTMTLVSTNVIKLSVEDALFIHSDICIGPENVLQDIYANTTQPYSNIHFESRDAMAYAKKLASRTQNTFLFWLTDENGQTIDTNGQNMVITLLLFKRADLFGLIKQYLKYKLMEEDSH
jgi:hypothetical protein